MTYTQPFPVDLSIVIVSWNTYALLKQCIDSIYATCKTFSYEIIVVDNNSSDETIVRLRSDYPAIELILNEQNVGFSIANNNGFEVASGKYILALNPDTILQPNCIDYLIKQIEQRPDVGAMTARVTWPDGKVQRSCARKEYGLFNLTCDYLGIAHFFPDFWILSGTQLPYKCYERRLVVATISGAFMLMRRDVLMSCGGFDTRFFFGGEDVDLAKRIRVQGWKIVYDPEFEVIHIGGASRDKDQLVIRKESYLSIIYYFMKHKSVFMTIAISLVLLIRISVFTIVAFLYDMVQVRRNFVNTREALSVLGWWISMMSRGFRFSGYQEIGTTIATNKE